MNLIHSIDSNPLDLTILHEILSHEKKLQVSPNAIQRIEKCRAYLDEKMATVSKPIYGINTGFGALHNVKIKGENLQKLQENLVMSHACGTGDEVSQEIVRLMLSVSISIVRFLGPKKTTTQLKAERKEIFSIILLNSNLFV